MTTKVKLIADGAITPDQITLTTASAGTNTTAPATTAFVQQEITALVDSSPAALNTLNELAAALGDDANFSTTVTNSIATKLPLAGGTLTGALTVGTSDAKIFEVTRTGSSTYDLTISDAGDGAAQLWFNAQTNDTGFNFRPKSSGGTNTNALYIAPAGNVGIGTTSPAAGLQVSKGLTNAGGPPAGASTAAACFGNDGSDDNYGLVLGADGNGLGYISAQRTDGTATTYPLSIQHSGGNVGIGTTTTNSFKTYIDADPGKGLFVEAGDNGYTALGFDGDGLSTKGSITSHNGKILIGSENSSGTGSDGELKIIPGTGNVMILDGPNGRVGIGTESPDYPFHVTGTGDTVAAITAPATSIAALNLGNSTNLADGGIRYDNNTDALIFRASNAERMRIDSAGTMILLADGAANLGRIQFSSQASTYQILGGNNIGYMGYKTGGYHRFFGSDGAEDMRIDSSGKVGIGTAPSEILHINAGGNGPEIRLQNTSGSHYIRAYNDNWNFLANSTNTAIAIKNSGIVTKPNQPAFHVYLGGGTLSSGNIIVYGNTYLNVGSHYNTSNGRFTAPVAGTYLFHWSAIGNSNADVYRYYLYKNGSASFGSGDAQLRHDTTASEYGDGASKVQMLTLAANDYVQVYYVADAGTNSYTGSDYVSFGGYLIG